MKRISLFTFVLAATLLSSGLVYGQCSKSKSPKSKSHCGSSCGVERQADPKPTSAPQETKKSQEVKKSSTCSDKTRCDAESTCTKGCGCTPKTAPKPKSVPQQVAPSKKTSCEKGCGCSPKATAESGACPVTGNKGQACPVTNAKKCPATGKTEGQCPEVVRKAAAVMPPCAECKEAGKTHACEACAQKALVQTRKAKSGSCVIAVDHAACTGNAASCLAAATRGNQTVCPVNGKPINKKVYLEHQGKRVYFSCTSCIEPFKKNAARYFKDAEAKGVRFAVAPAGMKNVKVECTKCKSALVNGKVTRIEPKSAPAPASPKKASEKKAQSSCCGSCDGDCSTATSEKKTESSSRESAGSSSCGTKKSSCASGSCGGK